MRAQERVGRERERERRDLPRDGGEREVGSVHRDSFVALLNQYFFPFGAVEVSHVAFDGGGGESFGKPNVSVSPPPFAGELKAESAKP